MNCYICDSLCKETIHKSFVANLYSYIYDCVKCDIEYCFDHFNVPYRTTFNNSTPHLYDLIYLSDNKFRIHDVEDEFLTDILESSFDEISFEQIFKFVKKHEKLKAFK